MKANGVYETPKKEICEYCKFFRESNPWKRIFTKGHCTRSGASVNVADTCKYYMPRTEPTTPQP